MSTRLFGQLSNYFTDLFTLGAMRASAHFLAPSPLPVLGCLSTACIRPLMACRPALARVEAQSMTQFSPLSVTVRSAARCALAKVNTIRVLPTMGFKTRRAQPAPLNASLVFLRAVPARQALGFVWQHTAGLKAAPELGAWPLHQLARQLADKGASYLNWLDYKLGACRIAITGLHAASVTTHSTRKINLAKGTDAVALSSATLTRHFSVKTTYLLQKLLAPAVTLRGYNVPAWVSYACSSAALIFASQL
jgi:hypothetical protein